MLDRESLLRVGQYRNHEQPVLSLYLAVDRNSPEDKHLIHLKNLMADGAELEEDYSEAVWTRVQADMERARAWIRQNPVRGGKSVAIFACGNDLWEAYSIPYELPSSLTLSHRARLRPLYRLLQRFERYLAILSDSRDARVFLVTPEETREVAQVEDDTPNRHDQGGWSQANIQRHQDKMVEEHLQNAAELAFGIFQREGFDGLILLGTEDRTTRLAEQLHPYLSQRLLAQAPMEMEASARDIGNRVLELGRARRQERQNELLDRWDDLQGGNGGVAGITDTLAAAQQGQLMTLIMREDLALEGGRCQQCGTLTAQPNGQCDYCGGEIRHFPDLTEALTADAMNQGAELIFLAADSEADRLDEAGGLGAILRFTIPQPETEPG